MPNMPPLGMIVTLVGYFGLLFLTTRFRNSGVGLLFVFALTGFMGLTLGPIISMYLSIPNGNQTRHDRHGWDRYHLPGPVRAMY